jgi:transcriptional regulator with XRE-family HTH domain
MTQAQVSAAMGTTQAVVARLEGGRVKPSTCTLERFAKATGTRLRIGFEPALAHDRPCVLLERKPRRRRPGKVPDTVLDTFSS